MTQEPSIFQFVIVPLNLCTSSPFRWDGTPSLTSHTHLLACNGAWPNCSKWVLTGGHTSSNQRLTWNTRKSLGGICAHLFFSQKSSPKPPSMDGLNSQIFSINSFSTFGFRWGETRSKKPSDDFYSAGSLPKSLNIFMGTSTSAKSLRFTMDPNWVMMCHLAPPGLSRCVKSTVPSRPENRWLFTSTSWK